jgi:ribonuclease VapC
MIVDSSAIIAILKHEPEARKFAELLEASDSCRMSTVTFVETAIVIDSKRNAVLSQKLDDLCRDAEIELVAVDEKQARLARQAYRDFGNGSGHKARLNLGDCFSYALAKESGEPLLFKGGDFVHVGVTSALTV